MRPFAMDEITVVWVSYFSTAYLEHLHANLLTTASGQYPLRFLVVDNAGGEDKALQEFADARSNIQLVLAPAHGLVGSPGHAAGLDLAMSHLQTRYTLICDPDIHVFKAHWDLFLIETLEKENATSIGLPYPFWRVGVYHHFPCPIFHFFETESLKALAQPWTPFSQNRLRHAWNFIGRQIVRLGCIANRRNLIRSANLRAWARGMERLFGIVGPDTGYLICQEADRRGVKRIVFEIVAAHHSLYPTLSAAEKELADQWELGVLDNQPILTHKYGSQGRMWATPRARDVDYWYEQIAQAERET